jgi:hypothetical protein
MARQMRRVETSLWLGSCFAEVLGQRALDSGYQARVNPMGVVFHPNVLARLLSISMDELESTCFQKEGVWLNYWLGTPFAASDKGTLLHQIQTAHKTLEAALAESSWLVITWGTALYYNHKDWGLVGKCHKLPGNQFDRFRSSPDELVSVWKIALERLWKTNPDLNIILTVSPVRHTREGLVENNRSKSSLLLAAGSLAESHEKVHYFPSYEMVMDELRDYRFFGADLIHPNEQAQDHIWKVFSDMAFPGSEQETNQRLRKFKQLKSHRPFVDFGPEFMAWQSAISKEKAILTEQIRKEGLSEPFISRICS